MKSDMKLIIGILVASIALIGGAVLVMGKGASTPKRENQGSASMTIDKKIEDLLDPQKREVLKAQLKSSTERQKKKVEQMWDTVIAILKSKETRGTHERISPDRKEWVQDDAV